MIERGFSEVDVREILEEAIALSPGSRPDRWVAKCLWRGKRWDVILEPDPTVRVVVVVTGYRVG